MASSLSVPMISYHWIWIPTLVALAGAIHVSMACRHSSVGGCKKTELLRVLSGPVTRQQFKGCDSVKHTRRRWAMALTRWIHDGAFAWPEYQMRGGKITLMDWWIPSIFCLGPSDNRSSFLCKDTFLFLFSSLKLFPRCMSISGWNRLISVIGLLFYSNRREKLTVCRSPMPCKLSFTFSFLFHF